MTRNGSGSDAIQMSPRVAALLEKVKNRMAAAPTVSLIKQASREALAGTSDDLTEAEIRQLTAFAISRAREIESHAARLAELLTEGGR